MNKLQVSDSFIQSIEPSLREYILLKQEKKYFELSEIEQKELCIDIITIAFLEAGAVKDKSTEEIIKYNALLILFKEITGQFKMLTASEIKKAFHLGVRREYGQYMGLNAVSYNQFLKGFINSPDRLKAMKEYNKIIDKPNVVVMTDDDKKQILLNSTLSAFYDLKAGTRLNYYTHRLYDFVNSILGETYVNEKGIEIKTLIVDNDSRKLIREQALAKYKEYVENYVTDLKWSGRIGEAKQVLLLLDNLKGNITYENYQKLTALEFYFKKLIDNNLDLKTLIYDKQN